MAIHFALSILLSSLGIAIYLGLARKSLSIGHRKLFLIGIIAGSWLFPLVGEWDNLILSKQGPNLETSIAHFTRELNVVDINDPKLQACYQAIAPGKDMCDCEVIQKKDLIVFEPNLLYSTLLTIGTWLFWLYVCVSAVFLLELGAKVAYLKWLVARSSKRQTTIDGLDVVLLFPPVSFPVSSFAFGKNYIVWSHELDKMEAKDRNAILQHETAHLKHKDTWIQIAMCVLKVLWWVNPGFYFLRKEIELCCEVAADRYAISAGHDARDYARLLLRMKSGASVSPAIAFGNSLLKNRVMEILHSHHKPAKGKHYLFFIALGTVLITTTLLAAPALKQYSDNLKEYQLIQAEAHKNGTTYFSKSSLLNELRTGEKSLH